MLALKSRESQDTTGTAFGIPSRVVENGQTSSAPVESDES
jgi:hypothetical protein